jgi:hypothetical protein
VFEVSDCYGMFTSYVLYFNSIRSLYRMPLLTNLFSWQGQAVALINYGNALDSSGDYKGALKSFRQAYE